MTSFRRTSTSFGFSVKFRESELKRNERYLACSIVCHVRGYSLRYFAIFVILEGPEFLSRLSSFEAVAFVTRVTTKERVFLASKRYVSSLLEVCFLGSNEEAEREKRSRARDGDSFDKQSEILVIVARKLRQSRARERAYDISLMEIYASGRVTIDTFRFRAEYDVAPRLHFMRARRHVQTHEFAHLYFLHSTGFATTFPDIPTYLFARCISLTP